MTADIARLTGAGGREKIHDDAINVKLPAAIKKLFEDIAENNHTSVGHEVRIAMGEYLTRRGY